MIKHVIILSGRVCSGKSTLAVGLVDEYGCDRIRTQQLIKARLPDTPNDRRALQKAGDRLDRRTRGEWVALELSKVAQNLPDGATIVVDAVRIRNQIDAIRRAFAHRVIHVHLTAPLEVLAQRYAQRPKGMEEVDSYEELSENATERAVEKLGRLADVVIDTRRSSPADVITRAASHLGFFWPLLSSIS